MYQECKRPFFEIDRWGQNEKLPGLYLLNKGKKVLKDNGTKGHERKMLSTEK